MISKHTKEHIATKLYQWPLPLDEAATLLSDAQDTELRIIGESYIIARDSLLWAIRRLERQME